MTSKAQQIELDNALVAPKNRHVIEEALSFIRELGHSGEIKYITDVIVDPLHQPWRTFASIINKCLCGKEDLAYQIDNIDSKKQDKMFYPRFTKIIIHYFLEKYKSISMRNRTFMHTAHDDSLLGTIRFISKHADTQVYGSIIPKATTIQALLDSVAYKTYYAIALGAEPPKSRKSQKKSDSAISSEESPSKKKSAKAKKVVAAKPKPAKKKAPVKADRGKGVPDDQHRKTSSTDKGTCSKSRVPDVPKYDSESKKESWGDSGEEEDDAENDSEDDNDDDDDGNDDNDGDGDDDDDQEDNDIYDDDEETDKEEEEEEKIDDEETMDEKEDDEVTKELYNYVNVNLGNKDADMTDADQELKQVDQYAQAISLIPAIMDRYMDNKLGEAIFKVIQSHNVKCKEEAQDEKQEYIDNVDSTFDAGNNDEQPADKETWISQVARTKEPRTSFDVLMDTSFDFFTFVMNRLNIKDLTQEILVGPAFELLKGTCKSLTELEYHLEECSKAKNERLHWHNYKGKPYPFNLSKLLPLIRDHQGRQVIPWDFFINNDLEYLKGEDLSRQLMIMKKYDYGHLEEIEVHREDQKLYKFREGDFLRLRLQDIEDMLLLLAQPMLTNLTIDVWCQKLPKKLNLTMPDTFMLNLENRTTYTAYSDPKGVIYKDQNNINRLMRTNKLHKFSDGMVNDVQTALHDIAKGIRMEYLPKRK
nr:hypothetical protein [Tanacetum cinerariifolium]